MNHYNVHFPQKHGWGGARVKESCQSLLESIILSKHWLIICLLFLFILSHFQRESFIRLSFTTSLKTLGSFFIHGCALVILQQSFALLGASSLLFLFISSTIIIHRGMPSPLSPNYTFHPHTLFTKGEMSFQFFWFFFFKNATCLINDNFPCLASERRHTHPGITKHRGIWILEQLSAIPLTLNRK